MIFRRSHTINVNISKDEIRKKLIGKHFDVHGLDFEVMEKDGTMKVIPHTELAEEKVYTLPITHLRVVEKNGKNQIKMKFKPRRIDIGGPTIALFFIVFIMIAGITMYMSGEDDYKMASFGMVGFGLLMLVFFGLRMNAGYFDYIRKIRSWVKSNT